MTIGHAYCATTLRLRSVPGYVDRCGQRADRSRKLGQFAGVAVTFESTHAIFDNELYSR